MSEDAKRLALKKNLSAPEARVSVIALRNIWISHFALDVQYLLHIIHTKFVPNIFIVLRVEFCLERGFFIFNDIFH